MVGFLFILIIINIFVKTRFEYQVAGASLNPCAENFAGAQPSSELETKAIKKAINDKYGIMKFLFR